MYSSTVDCDISSNEDKVALVVPVTSVKVKVTGSKAMFALSFSHCC